MHLYNELYGDEFTSDILMSDADESPEDEFPKDDDEAIVEAITEVKEKEEPFEIPERQDIPLGDSEIVIIDPDSNTSVGDVEDNSAR